MEVPHNIQKIYSSMDLAGFFCFASSIVSIITVIYGLVSMNIPVVFTLGCYAVGVASALIYIRLHDKLLREQDNEGDDDDA